MEKLKNSVASVFVKAGISANFLTFLGFLTAFYSGILIYAGTFFWAGIVLLISGLLDLMDGAVARASKKSKPFGGILDSSLDRYGDGFVSAGLFLYFSGHGQKLYAVLAVSALLGSFSVSYVRARAECVIPKCRVGFWERGERIVYLALGLLLQNSEWVLWVLAIATHWTALSRLYYAKKESEEAGYWERRQSPLLDFIFPRKGRAHWSYYVKIMALFLAVLLIRIS